MGQEEKEIQSDEEKSRLSALGQIIVGEIETIGGVLTADPITQAEGEFNVEVGTAREEIEDDREAVADRRDAETDKEEQ